MPDSKLNGLIITILTTVIAW